MAATVHKFPAERPNHFFNARFENDDGAWDEWEFKADYIDENQLTRTATFSVGTPYSTSGIPGICIDACDVPDLSDAEFRAHARMGSWCCGDTPGSTEWSERYIAGGETNNFQMACGTVKMHAYSKVGDAQMDITFKMGNNQPYRTVRFNLDELARSEYQFDPNNQWQIIAGAIKIGLGYVHKSNGKLTQAEKDDIVAFVQGLSPWI